MNTTISNNGLPLLPQTPGQAGGTSGGAASGTAGDVASQAAQPDDQVRLTDSARALQDAARVDGAPVVDSKRVEAIRQSIADGSYKVDAARIADRLMAMDAQIAGTPAASKS